MNRAFSHIEIKAIDEDKRIIEGMASTPETDRVGDIVEPEGAVFELPIPFLWQHDRSAPIGNVIALKVTKAGIWFRAQIESDDEPGPLKQLLDMAWRMLKKSLVRFTSIGFKPLEMQDIQGTWGQRFVKWEFLELSAVTIPANAGARITSVKSLLDFQRAASGTGAHRVVSLFGRSGVPGSQSQPPTESTVNIQEQIKQFQATRAAKVAAMEAAMKKAADAGETLDAESATAYDDAKAEVESIDKHLGRLESMQAVQLAQLAQAKAVRVIEPGAGDDHSSRAAADRDSTTRVIAVERKLEKGIAFARFAGLVAASQGNLHSAHETAKSLFPNEKPLQGVLKLLAARGRDWVAKAAVDIGTSVDADYAAPLVNYTNMVNDFLEFLRPQTIIGRIPNLRRVPFNIRMPRQTNGGTAGWVGEGAPKPVTATAFDYVELKYTKLATIAVITEELARFSSPSAEGIIRDTLAAAIIQQMDSDFVNPANAGTANVKPASITNGVSAIPSSGNTESDVRADIAAIFAPFITANLTPAAGVWIMSATTALALSLMRLPANEGGGTAFPGLTMNGGTFWGMPAVVSESVGNIIILANASDILLADDGQVTIDTSREASVQMDSAPTNPVVAATVLVSLWQQNLVGIRAERFINWVKGRAASVQYLSGVSYGAPTT